MALLPCILRGHLRCIADYSGEFYILKILPHVPREEDDVFIKARSQDVKHADELRIAQFVETASSLPQATVIHQRLELFSFSDTPKASVVHAHAHTRRGTMSSSRYFHPLPQAGACTRSHVRHARPQ